VEKVIGSQALVESLDRWAGIAEIMLKPTVSPASGH
jgi:hypothetical protein